MKGKEEGKEEKAKSKRQKGTSFLHAEKKKVKSIQRNKHEYNQNNNIVTDSQLGTKALAALNWP